jgi:UPF0755 protein
MRHVRAVMLGITLVALVVAGGSYLVLREVSVAAGAAVSNEPVIIEIEPGETTSQIATKLSAAGLIRQPLFFTSLVRLEGLDGKLQSGSYVLRPSMNMGEILIALQNSRIEDAQVTIPEGLRLEEVAARLAQTGMIDGEAFLEAASNGAAFKENHFLLESLPEDASLEGYLFPDTYQIAATTTVTDAIEMMLDNFDQKYATIEREVQVPDASVHDIVTMASVVQREAARVDEMPTIAAVFWNRLDPEYGEEMGQRLQADATVQYALGYSQDEQTWWRKNLTVADLDIESPYNTREAAGLPPGPISNPGLAALRAAAQPDDSADYLYFVANCEMDGSHNFATTFEEFQQYEAEFQQCSSGAS